MLIVSQRIKRIEQNCQLGMSSGYQASPLVCVHGNLALSVATNLLVLFSVADMVTIMTVSRP